MDTVTLTIDGRPVTVPKGRTVLQAAIESGIKIPYYCYHPGLGIDGSCRVCIVKIEKMPKLQTSCSTTGGRRHGRLDPDAGRRRGPRQRLRVPADQSPARLPRLRQGRRVSAPGLLLQLRPQREPHGVPAARVRRRGCPRRRRLRADADAEPQPLHPVHALRAVHARGRDRRADQHRRSRLRQRDRHLPGRGRALAALGQPDGRLPGRRHHDAGLSLQVAAVGQPRCRRHDLHALREGLQYYGVVEGQARMGEGREPHPHDAALQSRSEQLLDVRHRPLRLSLDRRGRTAAAPAAAHRSGHARADRLAERGGQGRRPRDGGRRSGGAAILRVGPRVARGAGTHRPHRRRARRTRGWRGDLLAAARKAPAARRHVQDSGRRCAEPARSERPGLPCQADAGRRR